MFGAVAFLKRLSISLDPFFSKTARREGDTVGLSPGKRHPQMNNGKEVLNVGQLSGCAS